MSSNSISFNQVAQLVKKFEKIGWDASRITQLGQANAKIFRVIEKVLDGATLDVALQTLASVGDNTSHLFFLRSLTLAPTLGTVSLAEESDIFKGFLDPRYKNIGIDKPGTDTVETTVALYDMIKDADFRTLFSSFGTDIHSLCLTQGQVKEFVCSNRDSLKAAIATFFLFEVSDEFYVAIVSQFSGLLRANVERFSFDHIWAVDGRYRVVVPQLTI